MRAAWVIACAGCYAPAIPTGAPCTADRDCPAPLVCSAASTCERAGECPRCDGGVPPHDTTTTADAAGDAAIPTCWDAWRSGTPTFAPLVHLATISTPGQESDPAFAPGELEVYFARNPAGDQDIYRAVRASRAATFAMATMSSSLSAVGTDGRVTMTGDRLHAVLHSQRDGGAGSGDLWSTQRASAGAPFDPAERTLVVALDDANNQVDPELLESGLVLYYSEIVIGATAQVVRRAQRATVTDAFTSSQLVPISGASDVQADPAVSPDELVMVFTTRPPGMQQVDLHFATRATAADPFVSRGALPFSAMDSDEGDADLSSDGCELIFASNRAGSEGAKDLFIARIIP